MKKKKTKKRKKRKKKKKPYEVGTHYEYKAKEELENEGYLVIRSAKSHSPFDLVVLGHLEVNFIQVKKCETLEKAEKALRNFKKKMEKLDKLYDIEKMIDKDIYFSIWIWVERKGWIKYKYLEERYYEEPDY